MIVKIKTPREINLKNQFILSTLIPTNFLLSLMIVFHHSFTVDINYNGSFEWSSYGITVSIQRFMYNLSECAVPMFYFLSAYLFYRTFDGSWSQYKEKIKRRFFSLFIPYIIFCTFGYIKHLVATRTLGGGKFYRLDTIVMDMRYDAIVVHKGTNGSVTLSSCFIYVKTKTYNFFFYINNYSSSYIIGDCPI